MPSQNYKPNGYWLGTNSGAVIPLEEFVLTSVIRLNDIATGISNICRFNGQIKEFYSVAQHCLNVSDLVPKEFKLHALLHDASEAYICDVPTPLKRMLGSAYSEVEDRIQTAIGDKFGVDLVNLPAVVKEADKLLCVAEHHILQESPADWEWDREMVRVPVGYRGTKIVDVRQQWANRVLQECRARGLSTDNL